MTITFSWWHLPVFLFFLPFLIDLVRNKPSGDYPFDIGGVLIDIVCWALAIGIVAGKLLFGWAG